MSDFQNSFEGQAKTAFDASQAAVTPTSIEAFTARAKASGLSEEAIAKTLGAHKVAQAPAAPAERHAVLVDGLDAAKLPSLNDQQKVSAAETLTKHWTGDPAVLRAALERAGLTEVDDAGDVRSDTEQAFDNSKLAPANSPDDYSLNYAGHTGELGVDGVVAMDGLIKQNFAAASVPPALAQGIFDSLLESADQFAARAEGPARTIYKNEQRYMLSQAGDVDRLVLLASIPLGRMNKAWVETMREDGALDGCAAIRRLAQVGELIMHREQLTKSRK